MFIHKLLNEKFVTIIIDVFVTEIYFFDEYEKFALLIEIEQVILSNMLVDELL
jgi:hypothetical protein